MSFIKNILARVGANDADARGGDAGLGGYDVIVIGAGHNGLVCGSYLAKAGRRVLVLEANEEAGGACQTGVIGGDTLGSRCAHLLRGLDPAVISDLGLHRYGLKYAERTMPTVALDHDGAHIIFSHNPWQVAESIKPHSEGDAERYPDFHKRIMQFAEIIYHWNGQVPGRLRGLFETGSIEDLSADAMALQKMGEGFSSLSPDDRQEFVRLLVSSVGDLVDRTFETDLLKGGIAMDGVLGRAAGPFSPGTALGLLHQWSGEVAGTKPGIALPEGGMGAVIDAMTRSILARRGQIRCNATVVRILVEGGRTVGVELESGERIFAPQVVSGTDPKTTLLDLLGREHIETRLAHAVDGIPQEGVTAKLNLVLDRMPRIVGFEYNQVPSARFLVAPSLDYIEQAFQPSKYGTYSPDPIMEIVFPTLSDGTLSNHHEHVMSIIVQYTPFHLKEGWDNHREDFIQSCVDVLGNYMSDLREHIIGGELLAPVDLEEKFNLRGGHWHHGEHDLAHQAMMRPAPGLAQYLGPVKGLYLCSAGCHPGGGILGLAGKNAAERMLGDHVEPLNTIRPAHRQEPGAEDEAEAPDTEMDYGEAAQ